MYVQGNKYDTGTDQEISLVFKLHARFPVGYMHMLVENLMLIRGLGGMMGGGLEAFVGGLRAMAMAMA